MYQSHFHLHNRPFSSAANPEHYFPASSIEHARESIARNVERSSSVTIVTGPVGGGKTLLCQLIANQYTSQLPVCLVQGESLSTPEVLLQSVLHKLGLPFHGQDEGALRLILSDHISSPGCVNGILLIIDDADRLPTALLDEVRSITNIVKEGQPCARVLLVGSPRLDENIAHPDLESLNQRIVGRLYLDLFSQQETCDYVQARIAACGGDAQSLFTIDSLNTVYTATHGVPRLVNQICDHALMLASINQADQLTSQLIEEAWADLQQLPIPSANYAVESDEQHDAVIEFGTLDESSEALELGQIEQTLSDLGAEASRAARNIVVGGNFEFETEHHDIKSAYSNPVLPVRSPISDDQDGADNHDDEQGIDAADFYFESDGSEEAEATGTRFFESTCDADASSTFETEDDSEEDTETVSEVIFEIGDDFDEVEPRSTNEAFTIPVSDEEVTSETDDSALEIVEFGADAFDEVDIHGVKADRLEDLATTHEDLIEIASNESDLVDVVSLEELVEEDSVDNADTQEPHGVKVTEVEFAEAEIGAEESAEEAWAEEEVAAEESAEEAWAEEEVAAEESAEEAWAEEEVAAEEPAEEARGEEEVAAEESTEEAWAEEEVAAEEPAEEAWGEEEVAAEESAEEAWAEEEVAAEESAEEAWAEEEVAAEVSAEEKTECLQDAIAHVAAAQDESTEESRLMHNGREFVPTLDQAANPFGHEFADEEVVIQRFVSPSQLARESYDPVTTAYSHQLSLKLAAAHPGLRMHPASEPVDAEAQDEFQPLSACFDDEGFVVVDGDEKAFSGKDDPVMPEPSVHSIVSDPAHDMSKENVGDVGGYEDCRETEKVQDDEISAEQVSENAVLATIGVQAGSPLIATKRTRKFRTLFSKMRGRQQ